MRCDYILILLSEVLNFAFALLTFVLLSDDESKTFLSGKVWPDSGYLISERQPAVPLKFCCSYLVYKILKMDQIKNNLEEQSSKIHSAPQKQPEQ